MASFGLSWVDYFIILCVTVSILISLVRGFIKESLSLASWIIAFLVSLAFADSLSELLAPYIETPSLRMGVSFITLFIAVIILGALVNKIIGMLVQKSGLSGTDRFIGMFFGFGRGVLIIALLVLLGSVANMQEDPWWKESKIIPYLEPVANWLQGFLPEDFDKKLSLGEEMVLDV